MTRDKTKRYVEIMQAYIEGKEIEITYDNGDTWQSLSLLNSDWNWELYDYRIKSETYYRPFKDSKEVVEALKEHGDWVVWKIDEVCYRIVQIGDTYVVPYNDDSYDFDEAFREFTFLDNTPFGKLL